MPFLRLARDQRGYETTVLLHAAERGERPRVLYWYRSAPGVRVGRPALDEDAIRVIEEHHPDIEFDWAQILEMGAAMAADIDHRDDRNAERGFQRGRSGDLDPRPQRGPQRGSRDGEREQGPQRGSRTDDAAPGDGLTDPDRGRRRPQRTLEELALQTPPVTPVAAASPPLRSSESAPPPVGRPGQGPDVLADLVGREIATRLRSRYRDVLGRIEQLAVEPAATDVWRARAATLNPDGWATPEEILRGVQQADRLFEELRRDMAGAGGIRD